MVQPDATLRPPYNKTTFDIVSLTLFLHGYKTPWRLEDKWGFTAAILC